MEKKLRKESTGTTLVEVVVASALLFVISSTIAISLSTVFDGYTLTQLSGSVEQDSQIIVSKMKNSATRHNDNVIDMHFRRSELTKDGSMFDNTEVAPATETYIRLIEGFVHGTYASPTTEFEDGRTINKVLFVGNTSTPSATLKIQLAFFDKTDGLCQDENVTFVGPDMTENTFYEETTTDIPQSTSGLFRNPAECLKYKAVFDRPDVGVETPKLFLVRFEK